jgi:hypothetical protein
MAASYVAVMGKKSPDGMTIMIKMCSLPQFVHHMFIL